MVTSLPPAPSGLPCPRGPALRTDMHTSTHRHTGTHTHRCVHAYMHAHACIHTETHVHTYTCMHVHTESCTHTHPKFVGRPLSASGPCQHPALGQHRSSPLGSLLAILSSVLVINTVQPGDPLPGTSCLVSWQHKAPASKSQKVMSRTAASWSRGRWGPWVGSGSPGMADLVRLFLWKTHQVLLSKDRFRSFQTPMFLCLVISSSWGRGARGPQVHRVTKEHWAISNNAYHWEMYITQVDANTGDSRALRWQLRDSEFLNGE